MISSPWRSVWSVTVSPGAFAGVRLFLFAGLPMPEIRFEAKAETVAVLDWYCSATGRCRTSFINSLLDEWAAAKLHEARVVVRVADSNPAAMDPRRKGA